MKINGSDGYTSIQGLIQRIRPEGEQRASQQQGQAVSEGERVEISPRAREIQRLKEILEQMPEVREKKVEELRALIQQGRYEVDLEKLSDRILERLLMGDL
jgi:negative regulator of flagellin synthesis FlgM